MASKFAVMRVLVAVASLAAARAATGVETHEFTAIPAPGEIDDDIVAASVVAVARAHVEGAAQPWTRELELATARAVLELARGADARSREPAPLSREPLRWGGARDGAEVSIVRFGAIPGVATTAVALANSAALERAMAHVNGTGGVVVVPRDRTFHVVQSAFVAVRSATLRVEGTLSVLDRLCREETPANGSTPASLTYCGWTHNKSKGRDYDPALAFYGCDDVAIEGPGEINGNGYRWWWTELLGAVPYKRPYLVYFGGGSRRVSVGGGLRLIDAPHNHLFLERVDGADVRGLKVWCDWRRQRALAHGAGVPMLPFNTDGVDASGANITIADAAIENFDDVIAVKPSKGSDAIACTTGVLAEGLAVVLGVGLSIGSVEPEPEHNCVRDVVLRRVTLDTPFKVVYVKSNSGDDPEGDAIIENVTFEDITATRSILWPVYVGPQQQKEPDGRGDGVWPDPQPLVTMRAIGVRRVRAVGSLLPSPGVLRGNATNPIGPLVLEDINVTTERSRPWICQHAEVVVADVQPAVADSSGVGCVVRPRWAGSSSSSRFTDLS